MDDPNATPANNNNKESSESIENIRDVLSRLQSKLQSMGETDAKEPMVEEEAIQVTHDLNKTPPLDELKVKLQDSKDELTTREDPKIGSAAVRELSVKVDREARQALRRVQAHFLDSQIELGAEHRTINLVEVVYHPDNPMSDLNYVTPRRKTAWVSGSQVQGGIDFLVEHNRTPRVVYIEGLLPPLFAKTLRELKLSIERETALMVYLRDGFHGELPPNSIAPKPPYNVRLQIVNDVRGAEVWWYVWKNAYYDVATFGVEPIYVGRNLGSIKRGKHIDILAYRDNTLPFAAVRVTIHEQTAHIVGTAIFKELRTPDVIHLLYETAVHEAIARGCDLVFAPGEENIEREITRKIGFIDFGSIVCYSAHNDNLPDHEAHDTKPMVQPILNLR